MSEFPQAWDEGRNQNFDHPNLFQHSSNNPLPHSFQKVQDESMLDPQENNDAPALVKQALDLYESALIAYAASILHGDVERAREVVQDSFLKLYLSDPDKVRDNVKAWLYTVCRNRAFDVLRKEQRLDLGNDDAIASFSDWRPDPSQSNDTHDLADRVWQTVELLSPNQQEVLRLKYVHDLSYKDIATATGLSVGNVGFIMHVAIKRLRELLKNELSEHPHTS